ncbi:unnamed protein product [Rotaria magnacalcarata]
MHNIKTDLIYVHRNALIGKKSGQPVNKGGCTRLGEVCTTSSDYCGHDDLESGHCVVCYSFWASLTGKGHESVVVVMALLLLIRILIVSTVMFAMVPIDLAIVFVVHALLLLVSGIIVATSSFRAVEKAK